MLIRACVIYERGTAPNCWGSSFSMTAGLIYSLATKSSANFDKIGVRDIGRRCFHISWINFSLGIGIISASFQVAGRRTFSQGAVYNVGNRLSKYVGIFFQQPSWNTIWSLCL